MSWQEFMEAVLPPTKDGHIPHISGSKFDTARRDAKHARIGYVHGAVDFNYVGGQAYNLPGKFPMFCPFDGTVVFAGGQYGTVKIRDDKGFIHGFLHTTSIRVKVGEAVKAGQLFTIMSNTGPRRYDVHIHYQIQKPNVTSNDANGGLINPVAFWEKIGQVATAANFDDDVNVQTGIVGYQYEEPTDPEGFINEYQPAQPGESSVSGVGFALWTNRVPQHEPWARVMMVDTENLNDNSDEPAQNVNHYPQFTDDNENGRKKIGKVDGDETYIRGPFWRR